jgi:hypothetical protein
LKTVLDVESMTLTRIDYWFERACKRGKKKD